MHLHELMGWPGPMTHRQFEAWCEWIKLDYNEPSRADFYAMRTAQVWGGGDLRDYRVKVEWKDAPPPTALSSPPRYLSTTDDPTGWYVPAPVTEEDIAKAGGLAVVGRYMK